MKKKKYAPTRRKKALLLCALCLVLAAANVLLNDYGFTRRSAIRDIEERHATYGMEELVSLPALPLKGTHDLEHGLMANENSLIHACIRFNPFKGWFRDSACVLDCSEEKSAHIAYHTISSRNDSNVYVIFFGRVDDPDISRVEVELVPGWVEDYVPLPETETLSTEEFITAGGCRYFYIEYEYEFSNRDYIELKGASFYNRAGEVVYTDSQLYATSTSMG